MTIAEVKPLTDEEILAAALQLPAETRARVAGCLLESLETPEQE